MLDDVQGGVGHVGLYGEVFDAVRLRDTGIFVSDACIVFSTKPMRALGDRKAKTLRAAARADGA